MLSPDGQLFSPGFEPGLDAPDDCAAWPYVVRLTEQGGLHYELGLALMGRVFVLATTHSRTRWDATVEAARAQDARVADLFAEGMSPKGASLVWDHGLYRSDAGGQREVYGRLERGTLEIDLLGVRLCGRFRLSGGGGRWFVKRLSGPPPHTGARSVLSGKSLADLRSGERRGRRPFVLWLEWEQYYADQVASPQVVVDGGVVVDLNIAAKARGVVVGTRLQHVLPLVPGCQVKELVHDPLRQARWLDRIVPYSDVIQPVDSHRAVVGLGAHPDPADIAAKIVTDLSAAGCGSLRYGTGPSVWLARLASRQSDPYGYDGDAIAALSDQPVDNLLVATVEHRGRLRELGFQTIGSLRSADPAWLTTQFGDEAHKIVRAARGMACDQVVASYPPQSVAQSVHFDTPVNDTLVLHEAAAELSRGLAQRSAGRQAGLVVLTAEQEGGGLRTLSRTYNRPVHNLDRLAASLDYLVGELQRQCPDIVRLTARLDRLEPIKSTQQSLIAASVQTGPDVALAAVRSSLGSSAVVLASQVETPRREQVLRAWRHATGWN